MGYLICIECGGYYQLQHGERPEDFAECQCGGELIYKESLNENKPPTYKMDEKNHKLPPITSYASHSNDKGHSHFEPFYSRFPKTLIIIFLILIAILFKLGMINYFIYYFMRFNNSNSPITYIFAFLVMVFVSIIVRKYFLKTR